MYSCYCLCSPMHISANPFSCPFYICSVLILQEAKNALWINKPLLLWFMSLWRVDTLHVMLSHRYSVALMQKHKSSLRITDKRPNFFIGCLTLGNSIELQPGLEPDGRAKSRFQSSARTKWDSLGGSGICLGCSLYIFLWKFFWHLIRDLISGERSPGYMQ